MKRIYLIVAATRPVAKNHNRLFFKIFIFLMRLLICILQRYFQLFLICEVRIAKGIKGMMSSIADKQTSIACLSATIFT